jgi:hypothetical protein
MAREPVQTGGAPVAALPEIKAETVVLVAAFAFVALALVLDLAIRHDPISVDFHTYLAAARVGVTDGWSHIYDRGLVAAAQHQLAARFVPQPFLSPPTVAFIAAPLTALPYDAAYVVWAVITLAAFAAALAASGVSTGLSRWIAVGGALSPWWVMHAVNVGQVVPLVAAGCVLGWRFARDRRDVLAGVALAVVLLKPNIAFLVPLALLCAWRVRAFVAWVGMFVAALLVLMLTVGVDGLGQYAEQLEGPLPGGADEITLHGAFGLAGAAALVVRLVIVGAVLASATRLRGAPGLAVPLGITGSLVISPYLHASDLCLLAAAGWMVWEERPSVPWRVFLAVGWLLASPFLYLTFGGPALKQWPLLEIAVLVGLVATAWQLLTPWADFRSRAPA